MHATSADLISGDSACRPAHYHGSQPDVQSEWQRALSGFHLPGAVSCSHVPMFPCPHVPVFQCPHVSMFPCPAQVYNEDTSLTFYSNDDHNVWQWVEDIRKTCRYDCIIICLILYKFFIHFFAWSVYYNSKFVFLTELPSHVQIATRRLRDAYSSLLTSQKLPLPPSPSPSPHTASQHITLQTVCNNYSIMPQILVVMAT